MKQRTLIASLLMAGLLGTVPGMALADGHGNHKSGKEVQRDYRGGDRGNNYQTRKEVKQDYRDNERVRHNHKDYVYRSRRFFRPGRSGLISVPAPIGAIVASLPFGFSAVVANGNTYFHAEGSYYQPVARGYRVCDTPVVAPTPRHYDNRYSGTAVVRPALLNVRSGPGSSFAVNAKVARGERLHIRGNANGWYHVETPRGISGWVMMQFTSPYVAG